MARKRERGEGNFGTLVGIVLVALAAYAGVKTVPVLIDAYAFRDYLEEEARFAALRKKDEEVRTRVLRKAQELELPVGAGNIVVTRGGSRFDIKVKYTVPIETPFYTYNWVFDEAISAPLF
jgi:hypothetical protein